MMLRVMPSGWPYLAASGPVYCTAVFLADGDALLTFQIIGIHHTIRNFLTFVEHVRLCQHGIDQRGLAVIDVCHNRYISNIAANRHRNLS